MKKLTYLLALLTLSACGSIKPDAPEIAVQEDFSIPPQPVSYIQVPIHLNLKPYFEETNGSVPKEFKGKEQNCSGTSYSYYFKRGDIKFKGHGENLRFAVDGQYRMRLNYCPECVDFTGVGSCIIPRIFASCGVDETMPKMIVSFDTKIGVTNDYKLKSKTTLNKVKAVTPCRITAFYYDATSQIETEVSKALKSVTKDIDKEIGNVDLKADMQEVWDALCEPIDLEGYGYMYIKPSKVAIGEIRYRGDSAFFDASLQARPTISLEQTEIKSTTIPSLSKYKPGEGFDIAMDISAKYDSLSALLTREMKGTELDIKGKKIIFGDINVHGAANHQLTIQLDFSGKKRGTLYLTGTPHFDAETQHISFPDLEFDLKTKHALLKSAEWLFDKKITKLMRESASIDLTEYLLEVQKMVNESINQEVTEGAHMTGASEEIMINFIHPLEDKLFIRVRSKGHLMIKMD